jgi:hypothetical protein
MFGLLREIHEAVNLLFSSMATPFRSPQGWLPRRIIAQQRTEMQSLRAYQGAGTLSREPAAAGRVSSKPHFGRDWFSSHSTAVPQISRHGGNAAERRVPCLISERAASP